MSTSNLFHSLGDLSKKKKLFSKTKRPVILGKLTALNESQASACLIDSLLWSFWFMCNVLSLCTSTGLIQVNSSTNLLMDIEIIGHKAYIIKIKWTLITKLSENEASHILLGLNLNSRSLQQSCSEALRINTFTRRLSGKSHSLCLMKSQPGWQQVEYLLRVLLCLQWHSTFFSPPFWIFFRMN